MYDLFERGTSYDQNDQKYHSHYIIRCSKCREMEEVRFNRRTHSLPPEVVKQKFVQKGWVLGRTRQNDLCPGCLERLVTERSFRANLAKSEAKRAAADLVISEAKSPHRPTHEPVSDNLELSRQQLTLLDRTAEIYRVSCYVSAQVDGLINRIADLEAERDSLVRRITNLTGQPVPIEEAPMSFQRMQSYTHPGVRVGYYPGGHQTVVTMSPDVVEEAKLGGYVAVLIGDGNHSGVIRLEPSEPTATRGDGTYKLTDEPSGVKRLSLSSLRAGQQIPKTDARYRVQPDGLYIRLPPAFALPPSQSPST